MKKAFGGMVRVLGLALIVGGMSAAAIAGTPNSPPAAPEIDPGTMSSALTLLVGGAFWLTGKARKA